MATNPNFPPQYNTHEGQVPVDPGDFVDGIPGSFPTPEANREYTEQERAADQNDILDRLDWLQKNKGNPHIDAVQDVKDDLAKIMDQANPRDVIGYTRLEVSRRHSTRSRAEKIAAANALEIKALEQNVIDRNLELAAWKTTTAHRRAQSAAQAAADPKNFGKAVRTTRMAGLYGRGIGNSIKAAAASMGFIPDEHKRAKTDVRQAVVDKKDMQALNYGASAALYELRTKGPRLREANLAVAQNGPGPNKEVADFVNDRYVHQLDQVEAAGTAAATDLGSRKRGEPVIDRDASRHLVKTLYDKIDALSLADEERVALLQEARILDYRMEDHILADRGGSPDLSFASYVENGGIMKNKGTEDVVILYPDGSAAKPELADDGNLYFVRRNADGKEAPNEPIDLPPAEQTGQTLDELRQEYEVARDYFGPQDRANLIGALQQEIDQVYSTYNVSQIKNDMAVYQSTITQNMPLYKAVKAKIDYNTKNGIPIDAADQQAFTAYRNSVADATNKRNVLQKQMSKIDAQTFDWRVEQLQLKAGTSEPDAPTICVDGAIQIKTELHGINATWWIDPKSKEALCFNKAGKGFIYSPTGQLLKTF